MNLILERTYYPQGVNSRLRLGTLTICFTIELPWRANRTAVSCIPEGTYPLKRRWSEKHGHHIAVEDVPGRSLILMHEANWAVKQLRGCIAPVTTLAEPGVGWRSGQACEKLEALVFPALDRGETVTLTITKHEPENRAAA